MIHQVGMNQGRFWETAPKQKTGSSSFLELLQAQQGKGMTAAAQSKALDELDVSNLSIWDELSQKYDVRNATIDEIGDLSRQLYDAGQITLLDHAILSFDPGKSPQQKNGSICLTPANSENKRDWIAEYQARAELALKLGDTRSYNNDKHIMEILERLQR